MIAIRYDIKPIMGSWIHLGVDKSNVSVNVHPPKHESLLVGISLREGWSAGIWRYKF